MNSLAAEAIFWPGISEDISRKRSNCGSCDKVAPSQPAAPPYPLPKPAYPFHMISSDYFSFAGQSFYIIVDRYSGWLSIYKAKDDGAHGLIKTLKEYFSTFGISSQLTSDGGPQYKSKATEDFLKDWGVSHRITSSYFPHSNTRAELGVKSAKRMLRDNIQAGKFETDRFLRALMVHRNTPDRETGLSPAQVIFGRSTRNFFPIKPGNLQLRPEWKTTMDQREIALARRHERKGKDLNEHTKTLRPLEAGQVVLIQNQTGKKPLRWDRSGQIIEILPFDQYKVKMDGSGRISLRNRRFLKPIKPYSDARTDTVTDQSLEIQEKPDTAVQETVDTPLRRSTRTSNPPARYGSEDNNR